MLEYWHEIKHASIFTVIITDSLMEYTFCLGFWLYYRDICIDKHTFNQQQNLGEKTTEVDKQEYEDYLRQN